MQLYQGMFFWLFSRALRTKGWQTQLLVTLGFHFVIRIPQGGFQFEVSIDKGQIQGIIYFALFPYGLSH